MQMPGRAARNAVLLVLTCLGQAHSQNECPEFEVGARAILWDRSKLPEESESESSEVPPDNELLTVVKCRMKAENSYFATVRDLSGTDFDLTTEALKVILVEDFSPNGGILKTVATVIFTLLAAVGVLTPKLILPWLRHRRRNLEGKQAPAPGKGKGGGKGAELAGKGAAAPGQGGGAFAGVPAGGGKEWVGWRYTKGGQATLKVMRFPNGIAVLGATPESMNGFYRQCGEVNGKPQFIHPNGKEFGRTWYMPEQNRTFIGTHLDGTSSQAVYVCNTDCP